MMHGIYNSWMGPFSAGWIAGLGGIMFLIVIIWSLFWKGLALWKSARKGSKIWFVVLLVINTVGILDILYIYVFSKESKPVEGRQSGGSPSDDNADRDAAESQEKHYSESN